MIIVLLTIGILSMLFGHFFPINKKNQILYLILCAVVIILQAGLRDATNPLFQSDIKTYYQHYITAGKLSFSNYLQTLTKDYGYYICTWLFARIFKDAQFLLFIVPTIICFFTFRFIYKYADNIYLSVFLFLTLGFYGFSLTAFRQSLAISICLWAYDYIKTKKIIPFILIVLLAASMHQTAIVFLPMYIIGQMKLSRKSVFALTALLLAIYFFGDIFIDAFNNLFEMDYGEEEIGSITGRIIKFTIYGIIFILAYLAIVGKSREDRLLFKAKIGTMVHFLMFGTMTYALQFSVLIMQRITFYFAGSIIFVLISNILGGFKDKSFRNALKICFVMFSTALFIADGVRNGVYEFAYLIG